MKKFLEEAIVRDLKYLTFFTILYLGSMCIESQAASFKRTLQENVSFVSRKGDLKRERLLHDKKNISKSIYNQNVGYEPAGWLLAGPEMDTLATRIISPYYESYGFYSVQRNYLNYDWGW